MNNSSLVSAFAGLFIRHALTALSAYLLTKYSITLDASTIELVVGGASGLAAVAWSVLQKVAPASGTAPAPAPAPDTSGQSK